MEFGPDGTLYVSQPGRGTIKVLRPKDGKYAVVADFLTGYKSVHGLHYQDGWLWFTTSGGVYKARDKHGDGRADEFVPVLENLPSGGHWWRSIFVVKDGFFTSIGDSGNISEQTDTDRQKIWKYTLDGKTKKLWSSGIRNTEKLRYRPGTTELFGADHGSDWFGGPLGDKAGRQPITDYNPPCEFNLYTEGAFYGHPYIVGNRVPRVEFQNRPDIIELAEKTTVPEWCFGAHWAPNGFAFITRGALKGDALVAMHGSWNASKPVGYRIERVLFDSATGKAFGGQMLVGTIGKDGQILARPVDVAQANDGTILFSDDKSNRIYRISKVGE
jgi:glucose/arabinose dehydrogenase